MRTDALDAADAEHTHHSLLRRLEIVVMLALTALAGCVEMAYEDSIAQFPLTGDSSTSTGEEPTPTSTEAEAEVQTLTGEEEDTGTTSEPDVNEPPKIRLFDVVPDHLAEAGPAELQLIASADVVKVLLSLDAKPLAEFTLADFPRLWEALSAKDNGARRTFTVVVEDAEGLQASAEAKLSVHLPQSGVEKCIFKDPDKGMVASVVAAVKFTAKAIYAVGTREGDAGLQLTAWKLDPNSCQPLPGWPKTLENWTDDESLLQFVSLGTAVDVDPDGNIVVAGNLMIGATPRSYVALLNAEGSPLWERAGEPGDEVTGVAAAIGQFKGRVFVVGSRQFKQAPVITDAAVWVYQLDNGSLFIAPPILLTAPFTAEEFDPDDEGIRSEWFRAVTIQPSTGYAMAVGEREFKDDNGKVFSRTFTVRVQPFGTLADVPWTSNAPAHGHDAAQSIGVCGDHFLAGGWTREAIDLNAKPEPLMLWLGADGVATQHRHLADLDATEINGITCDREIKIVSAATSSDPPDARVFTVKDQQDLVVWYNKGVPDDDGANAVACDPRGFCAWGGSRTSKGKPYAVVRVHHP